MIDETASIIMAAGRGSRMTNYVGNKTLLPLIPNVSKYEGRQPMLLHILSNLPAGPKAVVVHHKKEDVMHTTHNLNITFCDQRVLNGTGGALLAARDFLESLACNRVIITMGDVPLVKRDTYIDLIRYLDTHSLAVLGFVPKNKKKYGLLEFSGQYIHRIIEWKYWKTWAPDQLALHQICNSGVYAARKQDLLPYLSILESRPQIVHKEINGKPAEIEEYFLTDLVEYMSADGLHIGCVVAQEPDETLGVDDDDALEKAQEIYRARYSWRYRKKQA